MHPNEWMEIINDIENKFPVNEWKINDIYLWPIIRINLGFRLKNGNKQFNSNKYSLLSNTVNKYLTFFKHLLKDYYYYLIDMNNNQNVKNIHKGIVFLTHSINRRFQLDGNWYNVHYSPLVDAIKGLDKEYLMFERSNNIYKVPRYEKSCFIEKNIKYYTIKSRISSIFEVSEGSWNSYNQLYEYLADIGYADCFLKEKHLKSDVNSLLTFCVYFRKLLHKANPSYAFVVNYYGLIEMAFVLACKREGIPVIDIQHGTQTNGHFAYCQWSNLPETGYHLLPDVFSVWSEYEKDSINSWIGQNKWHKVFILGNLFNDIWMTKEATTLKNKFVNHMQKMSGGKTNFNYRKNILITLQPDVPLPEYIYEIISQTTDCCWWIRLHPGMVANKKKIYSEWGKNNYLNVIIKQVEELPLPALLSFVDIHVTGYSSVVIEAASFGVKSIIVNKTGAEYYEKLIEQGMAAFCNELNEFNKLLNSDKLLQDTSKIKEYQNNQIIDRLIKLEEFVSKSGFQSHHKFRWDTN